MKQRIARSVFWMAWSRGVVQVVSFASTLVVGRLLHPSDYGLMAFATVWTTIIAMISELGLGAAIIQFRDPEEAELNACFWMTTGLAWLGYALLYGCAGILAVWFGNPTLSRVLRVVGLTLPLAAVRVVPENLLRKHLQLDRISQAEILSALVTIPIVIALAWRGYGVWALVTGALLVPAIQSAAILVFAQWRPGLQFVGRRVKAFIGYSLTTLGSRIAWAVYQEADIFILGRLAGATVLGSYSMAKQIATLPVDKVSVVVNQLASPVMAELQSDTAVLRAVLLRGMRLVTWITLPMCVGLILVGRDLVQVVLTEKWASMVPLLSFLSGYAAIRSVAVLFPPVLMARYRQQFLLGYNGALLAVMPLAFWAGATCQAAIGVSLTWLTVYPVFTIWIAYQSFREVGVPWVLLRDTLLPPMTATLAMTGAVLATQWALASAAQHTLALRLGISPLVGGAVYAAVFLRYAGGARGDMMEVARWLLNRTSSVAVSQ